MRPKPRKFTVDFWNAEDPPPAIGNVVRHVSAKARVLGYLRVVSVRQVKVRVTRGEASRWSLQMERLPERPREGCNWTMTDHPRVKKPDRFSPLLPP